MSVHALEDDPFSVEKHQSVFQFKAPESELLLHDLRQGSMLVENLYVQTVKIRFFCTPEVRILHAEAGSGSVVRDCGVFLFQQNAPSEEGETKETGHLRFSTDLKTAFGKGFIQRWDHGQIHHAGFG